MISIGTTLQYWTRNLTTEEIDFEDDIHQETDARTQLADGYGGAPQGLSSDHKLQTLELLSCPASQCGSYAIMSLSSVIFYYFPTFIFMKLISVLMLNFSICNLE